MIRVWRNVGMAMVATVVMLAGASGVGRADDCGGLSFSHVSPKDGALRVDVRVEAGHWDARVLAVHEADGPWTGLPEIPEHAHLVIAGPSPSGTFAVVRAGGERDDYLRVLVYGPAPGGGLRLVRTYGFAELLTPDELKQVRRSISHVRWLDEREGGRQPVRLAAGDTLVEIGVVGGRVVTVPLEEPSVPVTPAPSRAPAKPGTRVKPQR